MNTDHKAKLSTLDSIIDTMDRHMLSRAKKKNQPAPEAAAAPAPEAPAAEEPSQDIDEESARKLMDLYGSEQ